MKFYTETQAIKQSNFHLLSFSKKKSQGYFQLQEARRLFSNLPKIGRLYET